MSNATPTPCVCNFDETIHTTTTYRHALFAASDYGPPYLVDVVERPRVGFIERTALGPCYA